MCVCIYMHVYNMLTCALVCFHCIPQSLITWIANWKVINAHGLKYYLVWSGNAMGENRVMSILK